MAIAERYFQIIQAKETECATALNALQQRLRTRNRDTFDPEVMEALGHVYNAVVTLAQAIGHLRVAHREERQGRS